MRRNRLCPAALISLIAATVSGCGGGGTTTYSDPPIYTRAEAMQHGAWTVLVYLDADKDRFTNISEIKAGTLPGDSKSKPRSK